jgi:hypothetical protein
MKYLFLILITFSALADEARNQRAVLFFMQKAKETLPAELYADVKNGQVVAVTEELIDNTGSLVDAIGVPGKIILSTDRWLTFLREGRDVRLLVFHEALRLAGINDDNYRVSRTMLPPSLAPEAERGYCDLRVSRTRQTGTGYGTPPRNGLLFITGALQRELELSAEKDLRKNCLDKGYSSEVRILSGQMEMSRRNSNGRQQHVTKLVLEGQCVKHVPVSKSKKDQNLEACRKVALCRELQAQGIISHLLFDDQAELEAISNKWRCL